MHAETAYLFRHALLRDAAYELQPPGDRAKLHALALALLQEVCGGLPEAPQSCPVNDLRMGSHASDALAHELALHAQLARGAGRDADLAATQQRYLWRGLVHARQHHAHARMVQCADALVAMAQVPPAQRALALQFAAVARYQMGRTADCVPLLLEAQDAARNGGDHWREGAVAASLAAVQIGTLPLPELVELFEKAASLCAAAGNIRAHRLAITNCALALHRAGYNDRAVTLIEQGLALARKMGDTRGEAVVLGNYSGILSDMGNMAQAEEAALAAIRLCEGAGLERFSLMPLGNLAAIRRQQRRLDEAAALLQKGISGARAYGDRDSEAMLLGNYGMLAQHRGDSVTGEACLRRALELELESGDLKAQASTQNNLASLLENTGRFAEAEQLLRQSIAGCRAQGDLRHEALAALNLAILLSDAGRLAEADQAFDAVAAIDVRHTLLSWAGMRDCAMAIQRLRRGDRQPEVAALWRIGAATLAEQQNDQLPRLKAAMRSECARAGVEPFDTGLGGPAAAIRQE